MNNILNKKGFISDMDGVIYHGNKVLDGVVEFINWMIDNDKKFVFLTNSPEKTPHELSMKLERMGLKVSAEHFYTSAMATAAFLSSQKPGCTAYVIGEAALTKALYDQGIYMNDVNPDYVVVGETRTYSFEKIEKAIELVLKGAKLIGTNPDITGPTERGLMPATGALIVIERQTKLGEQIETGTIIKAVPSEELFRNIFFGNGRNVGYSFHNRIGLFGINDIAHSGSQINVAIKFPLISYCLS